MVRFLCLHHVLFNFTAHIFFLPGTRRSANHLQTAGRCLRIDAPNSGWLILRTNDKHTWSQKRMQGCQQKMFRLTGYRASLPCHRTIGTTRPLALFACLIRQDYSGGEYGCTSATGSRAEPSPAGARGFGASFQGVTPIGGNRCRPCIAVLPYNTHRGGEDAPGVGMAYLFARCRAVLAVGALWCFMSPVR